MSSPKVRRLLNLLCEKSGTRWLEVGSWKGSTLVSALYGNSDTIIDAVAIDDFSEFQEPLHVNPLCWENSITYNNKFPPVYGTVEEEFYNNINKFVEPKLPLSVYNKDCFDNALLENLKIQHGKFNIYFYDGNHEEESQYNAIVKYKDLLEEECIILIDDFNDPNVKEGTKRGIRDAGLNVVHSWELPANGNGDISNFWAGIGVFLTGKYYSVN